MKNVKKLYIVLIITLFSGLCFPATAFSSDLFSVTPAVSFAWYPQVSYTEESTITEADMNNYGISVLLGLKLFDKIGAHLNLTIDDPNFEKLVDFAGYISAYNFMLKFDYRSFGGSVTWQGDTPTPDSIPSNGYDFRNTWTTISLLYNLDDILVAMPYWRMAIGISYVDFGMPVEYLVNNKNISNPVPGFGMINGKLWGITFFFDSLVKSMDLPEDRRSSGWFTLGHLLGINFLETVPFWLYTDFNLGVIGSFELEREAVDWMVNANNDITSIDRTINGVFMRYSQVVGFQKIWDIGEKSRIGLAIGVDILLEWIGASNDDIEIKFSSFSVGPIIRLSMRF